MGTDCYLRWRYCCGGFKLYDDHLIMADGGVVPCGPVSKIVQGVLQGALIGSTVADEFSHYTVIIMFPV